MWRDEKRGLLRFTLELPMEEGEHQGALPIIISYLQ
jgi:hypothetical protein